MVAGLIAGLFFAAAAWAAEKDSGPSEEQRVDWTRRMDYAKAQQKKANDQKAAAKDAFEAKKKECFKKFRVSACQEEAKKEYVKVTAEARRIGDEGKALERQIKKEQLADKDARQIEKAPEKEADLKAREAETEAQRQQSESIQATKLQKKEQKTAEGAARAAANEERIRKKQEQHDRKVAEKMEKARRREASDAR